MIRLANERNVDQVLLEFKEYATEVDVDFVRKVSSMQIQNVSQGCYTTASINQLAQFCKIGPNPCDKYACELPSGHESLPLATRCLTFLAVLLNAELLMSHTLLYVPCKLLCLCARQSGL